MPLGKMYAEHKSTLGKWHLVKALGKGTWQRALWEMETFKNVSYKKRKKENDRKVGN